MREDDISGDLKALAFRFFYRFSRFEFALKEANYLVNHQQGANALPNWDGFASKFGAHYVTSDAARALIAAAPKRQVVTQGGLAFDAVVIDAGASDLVKVTRYARTVRNNLFHGGKHGADGWDDPQRTTMLLATTIAVLDDLAAQAGFEADYRKSY